MQTVYNTVKGTALGLADQLTPLLRESCFRERGMLTPEEFVECGDHLVHTCPTWRWSAGDPSLLKSYLPPDKQFLVTNNVPCFRRCKQLDHDSRMERVLDASGDDDGWVDTHHYCSSTNTAPAQMAALQQDSAEQTTSKDDDDDDDGPCDMEAFEETELDDDDPGRILPVTEQKTFPVSPAAAAEPEDGTVQHTRTYNLNITYDNYYRTPRLWLYGFDETRRPLSVEQMYEDFSEDHAHKTITMENHPHLPGPPQASVHPCKHAGTMKKLVETTEEGGRTIHVQKYLIIFLKFMQAVIPTIEYDFTQNIQL